MPDVRFVFRANPRSHLFPDAEPAAEAAEIAAAQGKFWEMHDRLFETTGGLSRPQLIAAARDVGLDAAAFERDLDGGAYRPAVRAQEVTGWHSHVLSTPTFFINGVRFEDAPDALADAVARARRRAQPLHAVFREARVRSTIAPAGRSSRSARTRSSPICRPTRMATIPGPARTICCWRRWAPARR